MRHSTIQIIIIVMLVILLPILAYLQFQWLDQLGIWEQERVQASLLNNTSRFSEDFDRELSFLYRSFWLQLTPDIDLRTVLFQRYITWRRETPYPELLKAVHVYAPDESGVRQLSKFLTGSKAFLEHDTWPGNIEHVRARIENANSSTVVRGVYHDSAVDAPVIMVPFSKLDNRGGTIELTQQYGWIILELDLEVIIGTVLPRMVDRYYSSRQMSDFDVHITPVAGQTLWYSNNPDRQIADADVFDVRERFFSILYRDLKLLSTLQAITPEVDTLSDDFSAPVLYGPDSTLSQYDLFQRSLFFEELDTYAGDVNFGRPPMDPTYLLSRDEEALAQEQRRENGLWQITAVHKSGSLSAAINHARMRNMVIVIGILAILGLSAAVLVFSARRARRLARQQMEFVAGVTHELRTPLAIIRSAGDNLADSVISDSVQLQKYGHMIGSQGRRLSDMVEKILLFSRLQSGHATLRFDEVEPKEIIESAVRDTQRTAEKYNTSVNTDLTDDLPGILGDTEALKSVFTNLITNALKYGKNSRPVEIKAWRFNGNTASQASLLVTVRDYGRGIPAADLEDIFKPFYRSASVREEQLEGTGLGLSLVKQIIEAHNGSITVESKINQGSTFTVTLPVSDQSEEIHEKTVIDRR